MNENEKPRLQAATLATLKVVRKADFGVFLDGGTGQTAQHRLTDRPHLCPRSDNARLSPACGA